MPERLPVLRYLQRMLPLQRSGMMLLSVLRRSHKHKVPPAQLSQLALPAAAAAHAPSGCPADLCLSFSRQAHLQVPALAQNGLTRL